MKREVLLVDVDTVRLEESVDRWEDVGTPLVAIDDDRDRSGVKADT